MKNDDSLDQKFNIPSMNVEKKRVELTDGLPGIVLIALGQ
jgi:hypothetical protein